MYLTVHDSLYIYITQFYKEVLVWPKWYDKKPQDFLVSHDLSTLPEIQKKAYLAYLAFFWGNASIKPFFAAWILKYLKCFIMLWLVTFHLLRENEVLWALFQALHAPASMDSRHPFGDGQPIPTLYRQYGGDHRRRARHDTVGDVPLKFIPLVFSKMAMFVFIFHQGLQWKVPFWRAVKLMKINLVT